MIIQNNFNNKDTKPLDNYQSIGSTRDNTIENRNLDQDNKIIQDIIDEDQEYEDNEEEKDKWDFFR